MSDLFVVLCSMMVMVFSNCEGNDSVDNGSDDDITLTSGGSTMKVMKLNKVIK